VTIWLLAIVVAACAVAASALRLHRVRTALRFSPVDLARTIGHADGVETLRRLAAETRAAGARWETELLDDVLAATGNQARVASANEHLGDLDARLDWGRFIPSAAARLSMAVPLCAVFGGLARKMLAWPSVLAAFACAGGGAVVSLWVGREADRAAAGVRQGVDTLVERLLRAAASHGPQDTGRTGDSQ
jgi:hypothetical protein